MGDLVITIFLFIGVMAITAVLFGGWVIVGIIRFIAHSVNRPPSAAVTQQSIDGRLCGNEQCKAINAMDAKFCRRCGRDMPAPQRVEVRRAAML
jgi:ribosomal protein L40E